VFLFGPAFIKSVRTVGGGPSRRRDAALQLLPYRSSRIPFFDPL